MFHNGTIHGSEFSKIVGDIYDCVLEPPRWRDTLARIASVTRSAGSSVIINDAGDPKGGRLYEHGADQKYLRLFFQRRAATDRGSLTERTSGVGIATTMNALCREWPGAQEFYLNFIKPQGFGDLIAVQLLQSGRRVGWLSAARSGIQPRYRERERQLLQLLSPHLCQALALSDAIDLVTLTSDRLEQTVDALSAGVFLTDRQGQIVYMNSSAERQIRTGNALQVVNRRLTATNLQTDAALARALAARACTDAITGPTGSILALPDGSGSGYIASVLPLDGGARAALMSPFRASAGVFVQDPLARRSSPGKAFAKLHGLTAAELKVLLAIGPGLTTKEAARELGLSDPTVKTHLQRIFVKTGMSSQSELLRLLLAHGLPLRAA